jgi:hypothetical protein
VTLYLKRSAGQGGFRGGERPAPAGVQQGGGGGGPAVLPRSVIQNREKGTRITFHTEFGANLMIVLIVPVSVITGIFLPSFYSPFFVVNRYGNVNAIAMDDTFRYISLSASGS